MRNTVYDAAIVPCPDYEAEHVRAALTEALDAIGGLDWVKAGMKVGIKPNLAAAKTPEFAVCTHPVMVAELTKMLIERGAQVTKPRRDIYCRGAEPFLFRNGHDACSRSGSKAER